MFNNTSSKEESHYNTLGISETATPEEIKKAYRSLSLKYHPDRNPSPTAVETFQKISSAFEILGDSDKKKEYDFMRKNPMFGSSNMNHPDMSDLNDILSGLFFGGGLGGVMGPNIRVSHMRMPGMNPFENFNPPHQGSHIHLFKNGIPIHQKPPPINHNLSINIEQVLNGVNLPIEIERWIIENNMKIYEKQTIYLEIPKGIDDGEMIILKEQGNIIDDTCKGDIKVFIKVINNSSFERKGLDLYIEKNITLKESLCGFSFELKYINGKIYTINNQTGNIIPPEYQKIIPNMGLTRENKKGNLIIHFKISFPDILSSEQIEKLNTIL